MGPPYNDGIVMEYTFELSNRIISTQIMKYMTNLICYLGYLGVFEYALAPTKNTTGDTMIHAHRDTSDVADHHQKSGCQTRLNHHHCIGDITLWLFVT